MTETPRADTDPAAVPTDDTPEQVRIRREKRARLLESGREAYPVSVARTHSLAEVRAAHPALEPDTHTGEQLGVAGRVIFLRNTGKLCFATLQDGDGTQLQAMISLAGVGEDALALWKSDVDLGDMIFVHGEVISSRRGELSVMADEWQMASKSLRPLPVAHKEMNEESRVRQRYVDLIVRPEARENARRRVAALRALRDGLERRGFLEIETPMLQTLHGGAAARPFTTHSNALDIDLFLRIAPELFLKRAVVGGIDRVFEINRNFRNEGIDSTHSPEFAMLETYEAYGTYDDSAVMTRELVQEVVQAVYGSLQVTLADGSAYDFAGEWTTIEMYPSLSVAVGIEVTPETSRATCVRWPIGWVSPCRRTRGGATASWSRSCGSTAAGTSSTLRRSSATSPWRRRPWSGPIAASPVWWRSGTSTCGASSSPPVTRSSSIPSCSASASSIRPGWRRPATTRPWSSTRTSSPPWSTRCRPQRVREWASTAF